MYFHAKFRVRSLKNGQVVAILILHFLRMGQTYIRTDVTTESSSKSDEVDLANLSSETVVVDAGSIT